MEIAEQLCWEPKGPGVFITDVGFVVDVFQDRAQWLWHVLRDSQRRMMLRRVPRTRSDLGEVGASKWGIDMDLCTRVLKA
eukprot:15459379-Alexandrium_andersonii.AAC.1